jgi:serine kinase
MTHAPNMSAKKDKEKIPPKVATGGTNAPKASVSGAKPAKRGGLRTASNASTATTAAAPSQPTSMFPPKAPSTNVLQPTIATQIVPSPLPVPTTQTLNVTPISPIVHGKENESTYEKFSQVNADGFSTSIYKKAVVPIDPKKNKNKSIYVPGTDIGPAGYVLTNKGFKVLEKCGAGNYAKVYKVRSNDDKDYAVKIIDLSKTSKNYRVRFLPRELDILARLQHRSIVQIYEILQSSKMIFIFMEYTPNGTVADFLRQFRAIPEYVCKPMFAQIVDALNYMHAQYIAHRDLKLENILIDKYGQPKLTDFSYSLVCAKDEIGNVQLSRTFCGSLPYIPPEVLQEHEYDPRAADVWSLGVCLYVMLNDGLPFKFHEITVMLQSQLTKDWKFKSRVANQVSDVAKDLVSRMLDPDVKARITTVEIIGHPWIWKNK